MRNGAKGFLVVGEPILINGITYSGVNTNAWPIGTDFDSETAMNICKHSYLSLDFPLLIDFESVLHYRQRCVCAGIKVRMLYCEVLVDHPDCNLPQFDKPQESIYLGFDYAYPSGDYYSAVANDIIGLHRDFPTYWKNNLNEYGLLPSANHLFRFIQERNIAVKEKERHGQNLFFEKGSFVGFRIFNVDLP